MPNEETIDFKIHSSWERPEFKKGEVEARVKDLIKVRLDPIPKFYKLLVEATYEFPKKEKPTQLGIVNRHGLITRLHYASPFKGTLQPGDIILQVNNTMVSFHEKTTMGNVEEKTVSQRSKFGSQDKKNDKNDKSVASMSKYSDFKSVVSKLMDSKTETKITITAARLSNRRATSKLPPGLPTTPGYKTELVTLFQYKHLKLGLNMQQTGDKVVVNYTTPDTVAHITLNIGEAILAVNEKIVSGLENVRQLILDGCNTKGYVELIVEYPVTDPMKNMVRGQLANASKNTDRPLYQLCGDVRKYCDEGIDALKNGKELDPIWKDGEKDSKIELEKKKSTRKVNKKESVDFRKKTDEILIPAEWNSKLFVVLPPLKTKETEMRTDTSQIKK